MGIFVGLWAKMNHFYTKFSIKNISYISRPKQLSAYIEMLGHELNS